MQCARIVAIEDAVNRPHRSNPYPTHANGRPLYPSEIFGSNVFNLKALSSALPKPIYASFISQMKGRKTLDKTVADAVAHAVRVWAMDRGCTHFTHWFQPQTDSTAEKHDSFLTLKSTITPAGEEVSAIDSFSGSQLMQAEPDASSFPNGGLRNTFEARGYTVWDTTSPMFIQQGPHNTSILYIPSVFISYNGEALDEKTVLLRSSEATSNAAIKLLKLIGHKDVSRVHTTLGTEQEYFLVDRGLYALRPDLKVCGRALVGSLPPKHQQLEDHYFGRIPSRVLATMSEAEFELFKLGVPVKTRHNEVAPAQFEMAPIFEEAHVAVDHNLLTMDILMKVAHKHKLKVLFHEKPFKGVNGSGKHCNWSLSTDKGDNLLDPTSSPQTNYRFLLFLVAVLNAVYKYGGLLRAGIASASNELRLGANEAPPAIISVFLGDHLNEVCNAIEENRDIKVSTQPHVQSIKVGGTILDVKVATLPEISRDLTDRNRTSPFAFTGNKFEFRAVGAKQSPSFPVTLLNSAMAASLEEVASALEKKKGSKDIASKEDILDVVRKFIKETKNVRFEGDNYSDAWKQEAARRGLPNIDNCPDAFAMLLNPVNKKMLSETLDIFTPTELLSRYHVLIERYAKDILIEANTLVSIVFTSILPAAFEYRGLLAKSAINLEKLKLEAPELKVLQKLSTLAQKIHDSASSLKCDIAKISSDSDVVEQAKFANSIIKPAMDEIRNNCDVLEGIVGDKFWPFPKITELLFT